MNPIRIPSKIDEPSKIFIFKVESVGFVVFAFIVGVFIDHTLKTLIAGLMLAYIYEKVTATSQRGLFRNILYSLGFGKTTRTMVDPFKKEFYK